MSLYAKTNQSPYLLPNRIVLTGYMGAGKSTIGKHLAKTIAYRFIDTDLWIARAAGKSIPLIFETDGEAAFRKMESKALVELLALDKLVLATGGGALANEDNLDLALACSTVVYLEAPVEDLFERVIFSRKERPIVNVANAEMVFKEKFLLREPFYKQAHISVSTYQRPYTEVIAEVIAALEATHKQG